MKTLKNSIFCVTCTLAVIFFFPVNCAYSQSIETSGTISDSCSFESYSIEELLEYLSNDFAEDSVCALKALIQLHQYQNDSASNITFAAENLLRELNSRIPESVSRYNWNFERTGSKKINSGNRIKGPGGSNSIRVDDALDAPFNGYSPSQLVQEVLVTGCLTAENVSFNGNENLQIGYFNKGNANFPISEGIVLSTGNVTDVQGPNTATNITTEVGSAGDAQLQSIASGTVQDASVLEFDFIPAGDMVTFRYIFASEEYPEYSCSNFNDVFGFFVTSLDNDGIGYSNQNFAQLPGILGVVSVNNVHGPGRDDGSLTYSNDQILPNPN